VRGVPGGRPHLEVEHAVADDPDRLLGNRNELAPQAVEIGTVEPAGAALEPARVEEVRRPDLAHVDRQLPVLPRERPRSAGVIEVDVREKEVPQVAEAEPVARQRGLERGQTRARPTVDERRLVAGQQVRGDDPGVPEEEEVEELGAAT
jgi:hypothetical protein